MELEIYGKDGKSTGKKAKLNDAVFAIEKPNDHAIWLDVKQHLANKRQGTAKTLEKSNDKAEKLAHESEPPPSKTNATPIARGGVI